VESFIGTSDETNSLRHVKYIKVPISKGKKMMQAPEDLTYL